MSAATLNNTMTDLEWDNSFRTQSKGSLESRELEKPNGGERVKQKELNPLGEVFPFQCSCGVKHQLEYSENKEGLHFLTVK